MIENLLNAKIEFRSKHFFNNFVGCLGVRLQDAFDYNKLLVRRLPIKKPLGLKPKGFVKIDRLFLRTA